MLWRIIIHHSQWITKPTITSVTLSGNCPYNIGTTITITVTFIEDIHTSYPPKITISNMGINSVSMTSSTNKIFTYSTTITSSSNNSTIVISDVKDLAGNVMLSYTHPEMITTIITQIYVRIRTDSPSTNDSLYLSPWGKNNKHNGFYTFRKVGNDADLAAGKGWGWSDNQWWANTNNTYIDQITDINSGYIFKITHSSGNEYTITNTVNHITNWIQYTSYDSNSGTSTIYLNSEGNLGTVTITLNNGDPLDMNDANGKNIKITDANGSKTLKSDNVGTETVTWGNVDWNYEGNIDSWYLEVV